MATFDPVSRGPLAPGTVDGESSPDASRLLRAFAWAIAALYLAIALAAMSTLSPRVPYADGWRFLDRLLSEPFPRNVLAADNGHREVFPNLLRYIDLHLFGASQWLQIAGGMALLLGCVALPCYLLRDAALSPARRAGAALWVILGLCWMGNVRALAHGNESVHAYLIVALLLVGTARLASNALDPVMRRRQAWIAGLCGLAATFTFGTGIACFVAFAVVWALRGAPWRDAWPLGACAVSAMVLVLLSEARNADVGLAPAIQTGRLLRWLAAPSLYAAWPVFDPGIAARLPLEPLRILATSIASGAQDAFGPPMRAQWPYALIGAGGCAWLLHATWRCQRRPLAAAMVAVGAAWFALAVGGLIGVARLDYFTQHPEQLMAPRYVVWSSLFWSSLGVATAMQARDAARALTTAVVIAVALLPSEAWMWRLGQGIRHAADPVAMAAAVDIIDPTLVHGETLPAEVADAIPQLRAAGAAMFAWPETRALGRPLDASARAVAIADVGVVVFVDPLHGRPARRVRFAVGSGLADRLLLTDADGVARGLAVAGPGGHALGWMSGAGHGAPPRAWRLPPG